jgi:hypothetical protein
MSKIISYHEAGHAVAHLQLLGPFWCVHVAQSEQRTITDQRGREISCGSLREGDSFNSHKIGISQQQLAMCGTLHLERAYAHMIVNLAGPCAEARYRRYSLACAVLTGGRDDLADTTAIASWLWPDDKRRAATAVYDATQKARKLVRSKWTLITHVAAVLVDRGYIDMDHQLFAV